MKNSILILLLAMPVFLLAQFPSSGNKQRLGYQTTSDGLIWRGVAADTAYKPIGLTFPYFQLDTVNGVLRRYIATRGKWQTVGGSGAPTGAAGGDLTGTYPNPTLGLGVVISANVLDGTLVNADLANQTVDSNKIKNRSITNDKLATNAVDSIKAANLSPNDLAQTGASSGQALVWTGTKYAPRNVASSYSEIRGVYRVDQFGISPDSTAAKNSAKFQILLDTVVSKKGGKIVFGLGNYQFSRRWVLPYYVIGGDYLFPKNYNLVITGQGATNSGSYSTTISGTIVTFTTPVSGADTLAYIDTRGAGKLEMDRITFTTTEAGRAFLHTTFTTLSIHDCGFIGLSTGNAFGTNASNDGMQLGGTTSSFTADTSYNSSFQGYGTVIHNNFFNRIHTVVRYGTFCNNTVFSANNIWNGCGGLRAVYAYSAAVGQGITGNIITNNLFEAHYQYVMYFERMFLGNQISGNGFFDQDAPTKNVYLSGSIGNYIQHGTVNGTQYVTANTAATKDGNTIISNEQGDTTFNSYGVNRFNQLVLRSGGLFKFLNTDNSSWFTTVTNTAMSFVYRTTAPADESFMSLQRTSATTKRLDIEATSLAQVNNPTASLRLQQNSNEFWFSNSKFYSLGNGTLYGVGTSQDVYKMANTGRIGWSDTGSPGGGTDVALVRGAINRLDLTRGASGLSSLKLDKILLDTIQILKGAGSPEGSITAPKGSLYLNLSGGAGTSYYVKESGSGNTGWVAGTSQLKGSATLDFPSTGSNSSSDLTLAVTGAADGDVVSLGVPNASATTGIFFAWVSATNTVTVRFHNGSGGSVNPASGTFKVTVTK